MRYGVTGVLVLGVASLMLLLGRAGGEPPAAAGAAKEHQFGDIVLYVVSKGKDGKDGLGYGLYEKPVLVRLGDRPFLVGTVPDYGDDTNEAAKAAAGKRVWTPVSEVVQITEFKTLDEAKAYFDTARKQPDKAGR